MPETTLLEQSCSKSSCRGVRDGMQLFKNALMDLELAILEHYYPLMRKCNKSNVLSTLEQY